jgi:beta-glucanase (GH16 family)
VLAIVVLVAGAAVLAISLRGAGSNTNPRAWTARAYVPAAGRYDVVVRIAGGASAQQVRVSVPGATARTVSIPDGGVTTFAIDTTLRRGALVVQAVGSHFKPSVQTEVYSPRTASYVGDRAPAATPYTHLVWSDDFSGPAGAAPSPRWVRDAGVYGARDHELEYYTAGRANAALDGHGHLAIVARPQTTVADGTTWRFTSARLETQGTFSTTYGLIEARMRIPAGFGLWSSLWMLGDNFGSVGWPACGELDVMEALGQYPFKARSTLHGPAGAGGSAYALGQDFVATSSLASGFHTYGVSWSRNSITWLFDHVPYATATPADLTPGERWVFNHPFHLVLNLAVGGNWPGPPDAFTPFPAKLLVDWVRVYR